MSWVGIICTLEKRQWHPYKKKIKPNIKCLTINSSTIVTRKEEESAFGAPTVKEFTNTVREWIITGTSRPDAVYEIGDEKNGITGDEVKKALSDREIYLAEEKKRTEDYQAQKAAGTAPAGNATAATAAQGGFNF